MRPKVKRPIIGRAPQATLLENEANLDGESVACLTVFLTGNECQFRCLMCDLWKHTAEDKLTPVGFISSQVETAIATLRDSAADWIKLYNAANFFAKQNIPREDLPSIASLVSRFERVVVENHPRLLNEAITDFSQSISGQLEVAMGLETVHEETLLALNKGLTTEDYTKACEWLHARQIDSRTFVLLRPPGMSEQGGIEWAIKSAEFAVANGTRHISIIPVRSGNGAMEHLRGRGLFEPPSAYALEYALVQCMGIGNAIFTVDLWDWEQLEGKCDTCSQQRLERLARMNETQQTSPSVKADCNCNFA